MAAEYEEAVTGSPIEELLDAVERFRRRPKTFRSGAELGEELPRLRHACDLLELEFSQAAAAFHATDEYDLWGSTTPIDWIRHHCRMSGHAAAERVTVGQQLGRLPKSEEAMVEGEIGFAHLSLAASTARAVAESAPLRPFDESRLLEGALENSVGRFRYLCHHIRHAHDQEGLAAKQRQAHEAQRLELISCEDGSLAVRGLFDPAGGALLRTALEPLARRTGKDDHRSRQQRLAQGMLDLAGRALDTGQVPRQCSQRAHLQVTTTLETLLGLAGSPAAEMEFATPISSRTVQRLACDCTVTHVLLGADSAVIDVGRARRVVPGSTRRALNVRDRHCQWPKGCDRPATYCAAHHIVHWARNGPTNLSNVTLLCHRHHWQVHEGGWQLVRTDDGRLLTVPPPIFGPHAGICGARPETARRDSTGGRLARGSNPRAGACFTPAGGASS